MHRVPDYQMSEPDSVILPPPVHYRYAKASSASQKELIRPLKQLRVLSGDAIKQLIDFVYHRTGV